MTTRLLLVLSVLLAYGCDRHGHDHGAGSGSGAAGSGSAGSGSGVGSAATEHHHAAPHGGTLVVLGHEAAHLELMLDAKAGELVVYVLDAHAEGAVPIAAASIELSITRDGKQATVALAAAPSPLVAEEKVGNCSAFKGRHELLVGATAFDARIASIEVKGTVHKDVAFPFPKGNEESGHEGHDHDHK